jgi:DNA-binding response OmpR family regulator
MSNKILVIEDDPALAEGIKHLLESDNYTVESSADGRKGLKQALNHNPDLILLDINLPSLNGLEVCRKLREHKFINPIIMLTSRSEPVDKVLGLEIGADNYINKPFNAHELLAYIRSSLRQKQRHMYRAEAKQKSVFAKPGRRLLTVMFCDMKDYSKIMSTDEKLAIKLLETYTKIVVTTVSKNNGEIIESAGDSHLVTFESALHAVECALAIQDKLRAAGESGARTRIIHARIGIHLGDVLIRRDNIKGDAVNIAARIQQIARPGAVVISESVYHAVKNKVDFDIKVMGLFNLKNIKDRVKLYEISI